MNWEDFEASMVVAPPATAPEPWTSNGSELAGGSIRTPRSASAVNIGPTGRLRMCGSPSKRTVPRDKAATGGTNLITVPARPQSTCVGPSCVPGVTSQSSPEVSTAEPRATSAAAIKSVSRERRARRTTDGPSANAARTSARLVSDLLPGSAM